MRGRKPSGPEYVRGLAGSELAKERAIGVLETLAGSSGVQEVCQKLGISGPRFHQLRKKLLQAIVAELEPRPPGRRPRRATPEQQQVQELQEQLTAKDLELRAAQTRAEIALALPRLVQPPPTNNGSAKNAETTNAEAANADLEKSEAAVRDESAAEATVSVAPELEKKTRPARSRRRPRPRSPTPRKPT